VCAATLQWGVHIHTRAYIQSSFAKQPLARLLRQSTSLVDRQGTCARVCTLDDLQLRSWPNHRAGLYESRGSTNERRHANHRHCAERRRAHCCIAGSCGGTSRRPDVGEFCGSRPQVRRNEEKGGWFKGVEGGDPFMMDADVGWRAHCRETYPRPPLLRSFFFYFVIQSMCCGGIRRTFRVV